jgi:hypothetical protein
MAAINGNANGNANGIKVTTVVFTFIEYDVRIKNNHS